MGEVPSVSRTGRTGEVPAKGMDVKVRDEVSSMCK